MVRGFRICPNNKDILDARSATKAPRFLLREENMADAEKLSSGDASSVYLGTPGRRIHVGHIAMFRLPETCNRKLIWDVTPVPRVEAQPVPKAKGGNEPRDIAANLIDSYQQLWRQPFDGSSTPKTLDLPRSGKSDRGSILFDNAMFQIESAVKFAGSIPAMLKSVSDVVGKISDPKSRASIASMVSPSTILNKAISSERSFAGVSISLSQAKARPNQARRKLTPLSLSISIRVVL